LPSTAHCGYTTDNRQLTLRIGKAGGILAEDMYQRDHRDCVKAGAGLAPASIPHTRQVLETPVPVQACQIQQECNAEDSGLNAEC